MKNKNFLQSIKCAIRGLFFALCSEKNYKIYYIIALTFLALNLWLKVDFIAYIVWIVTVSGVFSSETFNTSIEHMVDYTDENIKPELGLIKDIAAAGVLCWGIAFFACEFIFLGKAIL